MYRYTCLYRPPRFDCLPRDWELLERPRAVPNNFERRTDLPISEHQFGVVGFARELTPAECQAYELKPLGKGVGS